MTRVRRILRTSLAPTACAVVALSVLAPFVLMQNAWVEWTNALWLVERQAGSMRELGHPTYFLHTSETGLFYPQFAFYGGSLFAATGALAVALGSAWAAFLVVTVIALGCAYGGILWLGRQAGLGWTPASLAALVVPTSPYFVTNLYGRGAWTEIVATSAIPLALAGGLAVVRGVHRPWPGVAALVAATALIAGSHNLTLVWAGIVCALIALIAGWALGRDDLRALHRRRAALVAAALALGGCLVAWSAIPSAMYGQDTRAYADGASFIGQLAAFDRLDVILRPYPYVPSALEGVNPDAKFQVPVYVLAWMSVAVIGALVVRRGTRGERRLAVGLAGLLGGLAIMLVNTPIWHHLPSLLTAIQFAVRLHAYVVVVIALLVVIALRLLRDAPNRRIWIAGLAIALAAQVTIAQTSAWNARGDVGHDQVVAERLSPAFGNYQTIMFRLVSGTSEARPATSLVFDAAEVRDDTARGVLPPEAGTPVVTNIVASPFVRVVMPWRMAGRDPEGFQVIDGGAAAAVVAMPASPWPVRLGSLLSLAAGAAIAAGALLLAVASWNRRRLRG